MVLLDRSILLARKIMERSNLNVSQAVVAEEAAAVAVGAEVAAGAAAVVLLRTSTLPTPRRSLLSKRAVLQVDCWYLERWSLQLMHVGNVGVRRRWNRGRGRAGRRGCWECESCV
jgi:hypothetical protein